MMNVDPLQSGGLLQNRAGFGVSGQLGGPGAADVPAGRAGWLPGWGRGLGLAGQAAWGAGG